MSTIGRISTFAMHQNLLRNVGSVQEDLGTLQRQISSGDKGDTFAEINGKVEQFSSLNAKMNRAQKYIETNSVIISRLQSMDKAITGIQDVARDVRNLIVSRRNPATGDSLNLEVQARAQMAKLASLLNTNVEGRYVFSGSKTDTPPVDDVTISQGPIGTAEDGYYQGDNVDLIARASDTLQVTYGIRANDEGFQNLIAAINTTVEGDDEADVDFFMETALDLVNQALEQIATSRAKVQSNIITLQDTNSDHDAMRLYWKGVTEDLTKTDLVAASTQVALDQATLQASFQTFSTISSLTLSDYLR